MYVIWTFELSTSSLHRKQYDEYVQLTLRRYTEASGIAYSTPLFRFQNYDSFFAFTSTILPERFNAIRLLQIRGSDYRLSYGKLDFDESTLNYKPLRRLAYRNPVLPNGPTTREDFSAFSAACFVITQMVGLEELSMELDHCTTSTEPRRVHIVRRNIEERVMPKLEMLSGLGLRRFEVRFTRVTLYTMGWTRQPFEKGVLLEWATLGLGDFALSITLVWKDAIREGVKLPLCPYKCDSFYYTCALDTCRCARQYTPSLELTAI
jgi:hypothetical protein